MSIHTLSGFSIFRDGFGNEIDVAPITLTIAAPDSETHFSYQITRTETDDLPVVDVNGGNALIALNSIDLEGHLADFVTIETRIGQVSWDGKTTQVLIVDTYDFDEEMSHVFAIGGDPLPPVTTLAELEALDNSITSVGPVPSGPLAPGQSIAYASLLNVTVDSVNLVAGTSGDDMLNGTAGSDAYIPETNNGEDVLFGSAGDDLMIFSDVTPGNGDFYTVTYAPLSAGITVNFDADSGNTLVDKGVNGTDNLIDALVAMDWNFGDGMWVAGTNHNDSFNLNLESETWLGVTGGAMPC